jgi:preprotein translocase subunit SecF
MAFLRRLYRGETNLNFIGSRKKWYIASGVLILICLASFAVRGFHMGVEFAGGNQFIVPKKPGTTLEDVRGALELRGITVASAQTVGTAGNKPNYLIRTPKLSNDDRDSAVAAITSAAKVTPAEVAATEVSNTWGQAVTNRALLGLVVFLVVVAIYLWARYERFMAMAALGALIHDLLLTSGVYSISGFEVTPATVIGLLTILGFSLYDTVVVFDKVEENTRGLLGSTRHTYPEAANLAVNQTLMRSINTSIIALLPVAGLLFVGAGILGVGTLKDLALVLFVGLATGAYSSIFLATPWLVDLKMFDTRYKMHAARVLTRRAGGDPRTESRRAAKERQAAGKDTATSLTKAEDDDTDNEDTESTTPARARSGALAGSAPRTGARPAGSRATPRKRPGGKRR